MQKVKFCLRVLLAIGAVGSLLVPVAMMYRFEMSQYEVFHQTYLFILYPIVLLFIGVPAIETIMKRGT
jgi:hypothetical protein